MNWDAIGAVGELIGAILVGATLIYLAFQLRQNTKALTSSTFQAVSSNMASNMEFFAGDPTISALLVKAQDATNLFPRVTSLTKSRLTPVASSYATCERASELPKSATTSSIVRKTNQTCSAFL